MSGLKKVALGDCVLPVATWNPLKAVAEEEFTYIDLSAIDQERKQVAEAKEIPCAEAPSRARQLLEEGDVLVSTVRPNLNGVARVRSEHHGAIASTGFCVLRPAAGKLDGAYAFQWVKSQSFIHKMVAMATGASYPAVSDRIVLESEIPLPPLPEQRRIAAILDQADALRAKRREALVQLDSLTHSIFIEMFGDPMVNPMGLRKTPLASLTDISTGGTPSRDLEANFGGTIPWIKTTEVTGEPISHTEEHLSEIGFRAIRGKLHPVGSIVVAMYGQGQTRGRSGFLTIPATCNQACGIILPSKQFEPWFMFMQIRSAYKQLRALGRGGNQENLNLQILGSFEVLLPPRDQQRTFAARTQAIESLKATHRVALAESDALFASLQHRAFSGQLS